MSLTELTPKGLYVETYAETRADIAARLRADVSPTVNVEEDSLLGNLVSIVATKQRQIGEALEAVYSSIDPDQNGGASQDSVAAITGTLRRDATFSLLEDVDWTVDPGTYAAGTLIAHVVNNPEARFANAADVVNGGGSSAAIAVNAVAEASGPVQALAGTLTVIAGAVSGWTAVSNPEDAILGRGVELDSELRVRREQELAAQGSTSVEAIRAAILREHAEDVQSVLVIENTTDTTDSNGLPPHSIEAIVLAPGIDSAALAATIFEAKAGGILSHGSESVTHVDTQGVSHTVKYSEQTDVDLYVRVTLDVLAADYVGDSTFVEELVALCDAYYSLGRDVRHSRLVSFCHSIGGVFGVDTLEISDNGSDWDELDRVIDYREIARFDTARVTVTAS
ncbi:MAG TPA: hypothetical protein VKZ73_10655, partial [Microbacterium sp.]|nr:hypothetical protein [Microbacterium sp.]